MSGNLLAKKVFKIASYVLLYTALAIGALAVLFSLASKKGETGAVQVFGYQLLTVESSSMEKNPNTDVSDYDVKGIPQHSLVFVQSKPKDTQKRQEWYSSLKVGDVLSFRYRYVTQVTVTHRITKITDNGTGGYLIELRGDNAADRNSFQTINTSLDESSPNYIIGKVTGQSRFLGKLLYAIQTPPGMTFIIIVPCIVIIVLEILRLVSVFGKNEKKKLLEEQRIKDAEIEHLKKRVAELEEEKAKSSDE